MAYLKGIEPGEAGWFIKLVYSLVRRKFGKLTGKECIPEPVKVMAHHPRLLRAVAGMESGQGAAHSVPARLKQLASLHAAMLIGCPF
jgi:4-carboxymuconolactone decarboxylase